MFGELTPSSFVGLSRPLSPRAAPVEDAGLRRFLADVGAAGHAHSGPTACAESAVIVRGHKHLMVAVVDALGNGPDAARAALRVQAVLHANADRSLEEVFLASDRALAELGGAALGALQVEGSRVSFAGVGSVELHGPPALRRAASVPGVLGRGLHGFREQVLEVSPGDRVVLFSDGVRAAELSAVLEACRGKPARETARELVDRASRPEADSTALVVDFLPVR